MVEKSLDKDFEIAENREEDFHWKPDDVGVAAVNFGDQVPGRFIQGIAGGKSRKVIARDICF